MAPINHTRRNVLKRITQTFMGMGAGMMLGGIQAHSANDKAALDINFSPKKISPNDKPGKLAGKFTTINSNGTHAYSLPRKIFGPSQFGVTSPFMAKKGDLVFTIYRRFPFGSATCDYTISDGTGILGIDYATRNSLSGTLSFADREINKTITIATMANGTIDKTVICTLGATSGSFIEGEHIGIGTIMQPTKGVYYFDATLGNDDNGGSIHRPKKTWAALDKALKKARPGDTFLLKRGETFATAIRIGPRGTKGGGLGGTPVIIGAYGDIKDPAPIIDKSGTTEHIRLINETGCLHNLIIRDLELTSSSAAGSRPTRGIYIGGGGNQSEIISDIVIENVEIHGLQHGMNFGHTLRPVIRFNHIHDNYTIAPEGGHSQGIYTKDCEDGFLEYNLIERNGETGSIFDWQLYSANTKRCKTRWNVMRDGPNIDKFRGDSDYEFVGNLCSGWGGTGGGGGGDSHPSSHTISRNIVYAQNWKYGRTGHLVLGEGSGNWSPNPGVSGEIMDGVQVYGNIFHDSGESEYNNLFHLYDNSMKNVDVYNNLIIATTLSSAVSIVKPDLIGISFKNNIVVRHAVSDPNATLIWTNTDALANVDFADNIYYNNSSAYYYSVDNNSEKYTSVAAFQTARPTVDVGSIESDPLIADIDAFDYLLQAGSPAIDFGHSAPADYYGSILSNSTGPTQFGAPSSDRFYIDGDELKVKYPLIEGSEAIDVITTDSNDLTFAKRFTVPVAQ